ncbi:hypothetical protein BH11ACT6_BH11ACT6_30680 [soil metagenome]
MANTTPQQHDAPGTPPGRGSYSAGDTALFGDPDLALFGGYGSALSTTNSGITPTNDGM